MKKMMKMFVLCLALVTIANFSFAQTKSHLVGVTYRTSDLQICNGDLGNFYKQYLNQQQAQEIFFENLHIIKIKSRKNFYLLAKEQNSERIYAFPLERHGNGLFLNTKEHVHITTQNENVLTAILQEGDASISCVDCVKTVVAVVSR